MSLLRRLHDDQEGAAMVEFVIVFPVQLFLTLALMQFALLSQARLVVSHAAFMGARAAVVADGIESVPNSVARRIAARTLATITSPYGATPGNQGTPPMGAPGEFTWPSSSGKQSTGKRRQAEAYGHLATCKVTSHPQDGYLACELEYDYVMWIPVANMFFAELGGVTAEGVDLNYQRGRAIYRIRQVAFCSIPWLQGDGAGAGSQAEDSAMVVVPLVPTEDPGQ